MDFRDLSKPSGGDTPRKRMKRKSNRKKLSEVVTKEVRHQRNAADHRGDKDALGHARDLTRYVAGALAVTQPYNPDGSARPGGDKAEFWEWLKHMKDLLGLQLPYERPRLASITMQQEIMSEDGPYETVYELRAMMMRKGVPVDHLIERRPMLEHDLDDAGAHTNGSGNAG